MKKTYLDLYYDWMESGRLPEEGLCKSLPIGSTKLFIPSQDEYGNPYGDPEMFLWGYSGHHGDRIDSESIPDIGRSFTPFRQNIVLFLAAMNGEL
jgi:hypothetical protein